MRTRSSGMCALLMRPCALRVRPCARIRRPQNVAMAKLPASDVKVCVRPAYDRANVRTCGLRSADGAVQPLPGRQV